jgi:hypothetical protein
MKKSILCVFTGIVLMLASCTKENYDDKYQPIGNYGNASIITSNTVTLNNWTTDFNDGFNFEYSSQISWPALTQSVVNNSVVMAYVQEGTTWYAIPASFSDDTYSSENWNFGFGVGNATISVSGYDDDGSGSASDYNGTVVKLVAITNAARSLHPEVDLNNYTQVASVFGLK